MRDVEFKASRVRAGEWLIGAASLALLILLFVVPWFGLPAPYSHAAAALGVPYHFSGWQSLTILRWLILIVGLGGLVCWYLQGRCLAPALPVCGVVVETAVGVVTMAGLYYRVIIAGPYVHLAHDLPAAFVGLTLSIAIVVGCYLSMRREQAPAPGTVVEIERLTVPPAARAR